MAHLGDRVAAFVDGQLSAGEHGAALDHLADCGQCQSAVRQQELVKSRMTGLNNVPAPPASLVSSLADRTRMCGASRPKRLGFLQLLHFRAIRGLVALTGASVTVTAIAYGVGPPAPDEDETVSPSVQHLVAEFASGSSSPLRPVRAARDTDDLGIRRVSATTSTAAPGGDAPEAVRLLSGVAGARGRETLALLTKNFDLSVGRTGEVDGRRAVEVMAGRDGRPAATYWIDESTGTLLRRVAYDRGGMPVARSEAGRDNLRAAASPHGAPGRAAPTGSASDPAAPVSTSPISSTTMTSLAKSGWPCHEVLAGDMQRVDGRWTDEQDEQIVTLTYTDGVSTLSLFEQSGALDDERLVDFEPMEVSGSTVWVRPGSPSVATWDDAGVVYTAVTDAGRRRLSEVIGDLPRRHRPSGVVDRVGGGVQRLSAWVNPIGRA